jgi:hypothetical protein
MFTVHSDLIIHAFLLIYSIKNGSFIWTINNRLALDDLQHLNHLQQFGHLQHLNYSQHLDNLQHLDY